MAIDSTVVSAAGISGFGANPYLWVSAAAAFIGLAAGQTAHAFLPVRADEAKSARRKSGSLARAIAFLSLGILAMAALLVLADKTALAQEFARGGVVPGVGVLLLWAAVVVVLAAVAGLRPLAAGLPIVCILLALLVLARVALEGWLPLRPATAEGYLKIARFLPYEAGPSFSRGHLELSAGGSVSATQEFGLASGSIAVSVELLDFVGPLAFLADVAGASPSAAAGEVSRFYRIVGIAAPGGVVQVVAAPAHVRLLDAVLPLAAGAGLDPGGRTVSSGAVFGLARRSRLTSPAAPLAALQPLSFGLSEEGVISIVQD
jgi:hypothetical protein